MRTVVRRLGLIALAVVLCWGVSAGQETKLKKVKLGPEVNTSAREIGPLVSADGQTLYFVREGYVDDDVRKEMKAIMLGRLDEKTIQDMLKNPAEEESIKALLRKMLVPLPDERLVSLAHQTCWVSVKQPTGKWSLAQKLPPPLNNKYHTFVSSVLPDGNTLVVGGIFDQRLQDPAWQYKELAEAIEKRGETTHLFPSADEIPKVGESKAGYRVVALTVRRGEGWSQPAYLRVHDYVNRADRNDFFLAPGNRVLVISIMNDESLGERDLYVSFLQKDGTWTKPKDLGAPVNSPAADICPFLAPDGVTMYFVSRRDGGYGGYDIYMTRRLDDTWLKWSVPKNLGPDINSPSDQTHLSTDAAGEWAFMAEGQGSKEDIYEFRLPEDMRPVPTAFIRGRAHDPGENPVAAGITYERLRDGTGAGEANADQITGKYQVVLPIGEDYGFRAEASGYIAVSDRIDLTKAKPGEVFVRDLLLIPIKPGATIRLNNIFFEFAKAILLPESKVELDRLVGILTRYPKMEIEVAGHTDNVGDDASNLKLSQDRAAAVMKYLLDHGVASARLRSQGYGESAPVAANDTDEHRQLNRRVEFVIIKIE